MCYIQNHSKVHNAHYHCFLSHCCYEASYMTYVRSNLADSKTLGWKRDILESVKDLYVDLDKSLIPQTISIQNLLVFPISFGIPGEFIRSTIPPKLKEFGRVVPGNSTTYFGQSQELFYRQDMSESLFALTYKKLGWDCMRHLDIISSGCLPVFLDISKSPKGSLGLYPKKLLTLIGKSPGLMIEFKDTGDERGKTISNMKFDLSKLDKELYYTVTAALLHYNKQVLSTSGVAKYFLHRVLENAKLTFGIQVPNFSKILYLTHENKFMKAGDYQVDLLLHGLKSLLGDNVVDFPKRMVLYKTVNHFNKTSEYTPSRNQLYGFGFSFGLLLDQWTSVTPTDISTDVKENIVGKKYDLIVLGSGHRDIRWGNYVARIPFWAEVCTHTPSWKIALVDGGDFPLTSSIINRYAGCVGHFFSREGADNGMLT